MESVLLYGSRYGSAQRYAQALSQQTGISALPADQAGNLSPYGRVIFLGGVYAGGVRGLAKTVRALEPGQALLVATVGLADPNDPVNAANLRSFVRRVLPAERAETTPIFHLRGGIDYQRLSFPHRTMMALLYRQVQKKPMEQRSAEERAIADTYGKAVDFVDFQTLDGLLQAIEKGSDA